jgi:hypothetical protein
MGVYDIQGINCVFQVKIGSDYKTVVCAKSFTLNTITDMKETTTVGSGFFKEFRPRKHSYTITFNGMLQVASLTTQEVAKTLYTYQLQFLPLEYQIIYEDNSANVMIVRGTAYVTSSLFDASPVNLVNATQELQGSGTIEVLDQLPTLVNVNITSTGDPAIAALIQFKLMNDNGDIIFDSGQLPGASGGDFTHPVNVTGQVQSGSYYFFWQVTSDSIGNQFDLDAPPTKSTNFNNGTVNENSFGVQIYDFTADRNVEFSLGVNNPPPTCVAPTVAGSSVPNGTEAVPWAGSVTLAGSQPFSLSNITKPSWMNISISENVVTLQGASPDSGLLQDVSFDITNACGTVSFSDTFDINPNANMVNVNWDFQDNATNQSSSFIIFKNGVQILTQGATGSGTVIGVSGDVFEARIIGPAIIVVKEIHILNNNAEIASGGPSSVSSLSVPFGGPVNVPAEPYQINATTAN